MLMCQGPTATAGEDSQSPAIAFCENIPSFSVSALGHEK